MGTSRRTSTGTSKGRAGNGAGSGAGDPGPAGSESGAAGTARGSAVPASQRSGVAEEIRNVVESALGAIGRAGSTSAANLSEAVEGAGRSLTRRVTTSAISEPKPVVDRGDLARALAEKSTTPVIANATGAALLARTLSRFRVLNFLTRRTPMWIVAGAVPALIASVARGADELGLVASHLAHRARAEGVEPDPDRVRRASVQILSGAPIDPEAEPGHGSLVIGWLKRAFRAALPFTAGVATRDPDGVAALAAEVDVRRLRA